MNLNSVARTGDTTPPRLRIVSYGFGHGPGPAADINVDLRSFRDPHVKALLRSLTGRDQIVIATVLNTPGILELLDELHHITAELLRRRHRTLNLAVGCTGGRHRSAVVAALTGRNARTAGWSTEVRHRDIDKPVLAAGRSSTARGPVVTRAARLH